MSYSLNSLKGGYIGDYIGTTIGVIKGDTRSLDTGSHEDCCKGFQRQCQTFSRTCTRRICKTMFGVSKTSTTF